MKRLGPDPAHQSKVQISLHGARDILNHQAHDLGFAAVGYAPDTLFYHSVHVGCDHSRGVYRAKIYYLPGWNLVEAHESVFVEGLVLDDALLFSDFTPDVGACILQGTRVYAFGASSSKT